MHTHHSEILHYAFTRRRFKSQADSESPLKRTIKSYLYSFPNSVWERILRGSASNTVRCGVFGEKIKRVETRRQLLQGGIAFRQSPRSGNPPTALPHQRTGSNFASLQRLSVGNLLIQTVLIPPSILQLKNLWEMRGRASLKAFPDRVRERERSREWGLEGNNVA